MVFVLIGIVIGILLAVILIVKILKTSPQQVLGTERCCKKCGTETHGLNCPKCEGKTKSFGV